MAHGTLVMVLSAGLPRETTYFIFAHVSCARFMCSRVGKLAFSTDVSSSNQPTNQTRMTGVFGLDGFFWLHDVVHVCIVYFFRCWFIVTFAKQVTSNNRGRFTGAPQLPTITTLVEPTYLRY